MSDTHEQLIDAINRYVEENAKFTERGIKASAPRARQAIQDMIAAGKVRRKEINIEKAAMGPKIIGKPKE